MGNILVQQFIWVQTKSDTMLRVYEKNYERQQRGYEVDTDIWNRWELVLKHEKANDFVNQLLENGYSFGGYSKGY